MAMAYVRRLLRIIVFLAISLVFAAFTRIAHIPLHPRSPTFATARFDGSKGPGNDVPLSHAVRFDNRNTSQKWTKPEGIQITGGRVMSNILDCYLRQNLVSNGCYLDEVVFKVNTKQMHHVRWLDELVKEEPLNRNRYATDGDTIYIKIDDDVVRPFSPPRWRILRLTAR